MSPKYGRRKPDSRTRTEREMAERHQERVDRARLAYEAYDLRWPDGDADPEALYFGSWGDPEGSES